MHFNKKIRDKKKIVFFMPFIGGGGVEKNLFLIGNFFRLDKTFSTEEKSILEDLIVAAHNNAKLQLKSKTSEEIAKATGDFGIPGFKWPF